MWNLSPLHPSTPPPLSTIKAQYRACLSPFFSCWWFKVQCTNSPSLLTLVSWATVSLGGLMGECANKTDLRSEKPLETVWCMLVRWFGFRPEAVRVWLRDKLEVIQLLLVTRQKPRVLPQEGFPLHVLCLKIKIVEDGLNGDYFSLNNTSHYFYLGLLFFCWKLALMMVSCSLCAFLPTELRVPRGWRPNLWLLLTALCFGPSWPPEGECQSDKRPSFSTPDKEVSFSGCGDVRKPPS